VEAPKAATKASKGPRLVTKRTPRLVAVH
jgi:hypothetical protein